MGPRDIHDISIAVQVSMDDNGGVESIGTPIVVTPTKTMLDLADMTSHGLIGMSPHDLSSHDLSGMSPLDLADMTQPGVDDESCPVDVCGSGSGQSDSMQTPILCGQDSGCDMATMLKASQGYVLTVELVVIDLMCSLWS